MTEEVLKTEEEVKEERVWTEMQARAIEERSRTLLVSAGAGSGKTAVLTERILASILDKSKPIDLQDMLIVTYTRPAAGELRERIGNEIKKRLASEPGNARLEAQLRMLPGARICTIDSFCADLVRQNSERLGLSPSFRVPDAAEAELVAENLLDGMLGEMYEDRMEDVATAEEIAELCDALTDNGRQANLSVILRMLYSSTRNAYEGVEAIGELVEEYNPDKFTTVEKTRLGGYAMERLAEMCRHYRNVFEGMLIEISGSNSDKAPKLINMLKGDIDFLDRALSACEAGYEQARSIVHGVSFDRSASNTDPSLPPTTYIRGQFTSRISELAKEFFFAPSEHWRSVYSSLYRILSTLVRVLRRFDGLYRREKLRIGICDFADLERFAYELLWDGDSLTDIAYLQRDIFSAVYIDEYQDVNSLQDRIFRAITRPGCGFMVGDIKQSIYKFRSAAADIFADMKRTYPEIDSAEEGENATIFMSDNFRCDRGVINFVNEVFDRIFYHLRECIGYVKEDRLLCSKYKNKPQKEPPLCEPELCLINLSALNKRNKALGLGRVSPDRSTAALVAEKIAELLDGGRLNDGTLIKPQHIAIIIRKARGRAEIYRDALAERDIPAVLAERTQFFTNPTILLALSLLNSIDNPSKDIYLASLMLSPLYGFTADELSMIKSEGDAYTLYSSLIRYLKAHPEYKRGEAFKADIDKYRLLAEGTPTDVLLMRLYHETGLLSLGAMEGAKDQLMRLYESAREFERSSFKGLYNFINYINSILSRNNSMDKREAPKAEQEVSILTAHGSKGLEFPIVFFVSPEQGMGGGRPDIPTRFEYVEHFGIGLPTRTEGGLALVRNSTRPIIEEYARRAEVEEMSRVLYVILTRARERLFIVGTAGRDTEKVLEEMAAEREYLSDYSVYGLSSPLEMLLASKDMPVLSPFEFVKELPPSLSPDCRDASELLEDEEILDTDAVLEHDYTPEDLEELKQRFTFEYPKKHLTELPEKMAVSVLYPTALDDTEEDGRAMERAKLHFPGLNVLPEFMGGEESDSSAKRGISTHLFMQFFDMDFLLKFGVDKELSRLVAQGFLSEKDVSRLHRDELELFLNSELLSLMRGGVKLYREMRFNVRLPAVMLAESERAQELYRGEEILVQGVIDCIIEDEEGGLHLVDYKTDRLNRAELADREKARARMNDAHAEQLTYYSEAIYRMFGRRPVTVQVYSTMLGELLDIDRISSFDKA